MVKKEKKSRDNKYSRREFLLSTGKAFAGAGIFGTVGHYLGKGFQFGKEILESALKPVAYVSEETAKFGEKIDEIFEDINTYNPFRGKSIKKTESKKTTPKEKEISRRDFFYKIFKHFYHNPVTDATIAGAGFGGGKSIYNTIIHQGANRKIAKLKDTSSHLEEKIKLLEKKILSFIGFIVLVISLIIGPLNLTGFAISNKNYFESIPLSFGIFIISLILIFLGNRK